METQVFNILSMFEKLFTPYFNGFMGKYRLKKLKIRLKNEITEKILRKYGNEVFYNDFDHFLTDNDIIVNIINNCADSTCFCYKSKNQQTEYYLQLFVERYPQHAKYHYRIKEILQKYFEVIFYAINRIDDEKVKVISNIVSELSSELSQQIDDSSKMLSAINKKVEKLIELQTNTDEFKFDYSQYSEYIVNLANSHLTGNYIHREVCPYGDKDTNCDSFSVLLKEKRVLLLGEAGSGKSYESLSVLKEASLNSKTEDLIPIYLPLCEYGILYQTIKDGIIAKISPFVNGNIEYVFSEWFASGRIILILDGIDDVSTPDLHLKLVSDINTFSMQYIKNHYFITSRFNRYSGEIANVNMYQFRNLDRSTIRKSLFESNIHVDIPERYYQLFENPLYLSVGKTVLQKTHHKDLFNRSALFDELVILLFKKPDNTKGIFSAQPICQTDALRALGKFAYETFTQSSYSMIEFEQEISKSIISNKSLTISFLLSSGLLKVDNRVSFSHKLFKEYCAAYYIINRYSLKDNKALFLDMVNNPVWKEVVIFSAGMFKDYEAQDEFLDFVMANNLSLYVECVNAKSDLNLSHEDQSYKQKATRYLDQILRTYSFIVEKYLFPISSRFEPFSPDKNDSFSSNDIRIVGCLSSDESWLSYWFEQNLENQNNIVCINESDMKDYLNEYTEKIAELRGRFIRHGINLKLSGLDGDSGRKIAIDIIKSRLKELLEKRLLIEDAYLMCERVNCSKNKLSFLREVNSLNEMKEAIDNQFRKANVDFSRCSGYIYNGVDLFELRSEIDTLLRENADFQNNLLPDRDITPSGKTSYGILDFYSKEQIKKRISDFFYFYEKSYLYMIEGNFPELYKTFLRYIDSPQQAKVTINYYAENEGESSVDSLLYYYIASPEECVIRPRIVESVGQHINTLHERNQIFNEIRESYIKKGKEAHLFTYTSASPNFMFYSYPSGNKKPLSGFVYKSIKESLEEVFGKL